MMTTTWKNCEVREFGFTEESTAQDAHLVELEASSERRKEGVDGHVAKELEGAMEKEGV
jgi:hypothetical protein